MNVRSLLALLLIASTMTIWSQEAESLQTKSYQVSPKFRDLVIGSLPFEDIAAVVPGTITEMLAKIEVTVAPGGSIALDEAKHILTVKAKSAEFELVESFLESLQKVAEKQIHLYQEWIEVDHILFSDWLFENRLDSEGTELRNQAQAWLKEGKAVIIDSALVSGLSGKRFKVESVDEYIYPTEYDPAEIPNKVTLKNGAQAPVTAVTPTAFEVRNLGTTFEAEPYLEEDSVTIHVNLSPEIVELKEVVSWHKKQTDVRFQTQLPIFYTQKIYTQVVGRVGKYIFLGTTRPLKPTDPKMTTDRIVLQFLRADVSSIADWSIIEK